MSKLKHVVATLILLISTGVNAIYIDTINGPPSAFHIEREGKKLKKIAPFLPLQVGDKIIVSKRTHTFEQIRDKENSISLALDDGIFKTLKYADTQEKPYIVTAATHSPNVVSGVMNTVSVWFHRLWKNDIQTQPLHVLDGEAHTSPPMSMYLFKGKNAKLIAGERELHFAWYGGKPPYQVQVYQIGAEKRLWDEKKSTTIDIVFKKQILTAGRYQVVVNDAQGKDIVAEFTAVTDAPLQDSEAQAIEQSNLPELSKKTLLAVLLAKQEGWYFEAYQRVASITGYYPAQLLKQGLEMGERPE
ncbi:hypothetical protein QUF54_09045 [Candidatus Marithioploca araucensis]|uniref:Uncharacterized protein n=1 Tax=Candidatus Marithioploca araucensis TaxID=70273 RepID=A0ABT7VVE5_9GAMM|nr:hypothetical protein [Candidatus Marithioploca araucensis]